MDDICGIMTDRRRVFCKLASSRKRCLWCASIEVPDLLAGNPLARSRLVLDTARRGLSTNGATEGAPALQTLIKEAADALHASPRDAKLYRALYHTYFQPAPTQERAAEILDLPFSTYRRHLTAGVAQVTEALWQREVGATVERSHV